jgi:PHD/YefM family antitoxin component YafN of YafNO toxin-antitoxin module
MNETIMLAEARERFDELLKAVRTSSARFLIIDSGEEQAAIISPDDFHRFISWQEEQQTIAEELAEADEWEAEHPEQVEQWWYQVGQASLARLWEHPDEDLYSLEDE